MTMHCNGKMGTRKAAKSGNKFLGQFLISLLANLRALTMGRWKGDRQRQRPALQTLVSLSLSTAVKARLMIKILSQSLINFFKTSKYIAFIPGGLPISAQIDLWIWSLTFWPPWKMLRWAKWSSNQWIWQPLKTWLQRIRDPTKLTCISALRILNLSTLVFSSV